MCKAANHPSGCDCGFGGDTGGGGWHWGSVSNFVENYAPPSFGWARDHGGTVESYVNPNAHCPVCGCPVYFYRSPYNGRVFFDAPDALVFLGDLLSPAEIAAARAFLRGAGAGAGSGAPPR